MKQFGRDLVDVGLRGAGVGLGVFWIVACNVATFDLFLVFWAFLCISEGYLLRTCV